MVPAYLRGFSLLQANLAPTRKTACSAVSEPSLPHERSEPAHRVSAVGAAVTGERSEPALPQERSECGPSASESEPAYRVSAVSAAVTGEQSEPAQPHERSEC
jgi:hypothetical protein